MVFPVILSSSLAFDEEYTDTTVLDSSTALHKISTTKSRAETVITVTENHAEEQVVADATFVEEPESISYDGCITTSPIPLSPEPPATPIPSPDSIPRSTYTTRLHHRLPSDSGFGRRPTLSPISPATTGPERMNTRRMTTAHTLPPKFTLDDASRGPPKDTLRRGLSVSLSPGVAPAMFLEDPEALEDVWNVYAREVAQADRRMIAGWHRSLDTRLLFSGIFSAVLTPFIAESYKMLDGSKPSPPFFGAGGYVVRINAMWFGSLIVSMIAALLSIHCKQWLDGYLAGMHFPSTAENQSATLQRACRLRQYRFQGLQNFYIEEVIGLLPVILYLALLFFAIGLIDLLWHLNKGIAIYISVLCATVVVFHVTTTVLPFFTTRTPFRTPLSNFLGNLWRGMLQGRICVKGPIEEEEQRDVELLAPALDLKCFKWLQNNTESEEYYKLAFRAEMQHIRQNPIPMSRNPNLPNGLFLTV